jgi:hypothetical protein
VSKQRYLGLRDYGMGGLWWWVHARLTREVLETFAEVEIVDVRVTSHGLPIGSARRSTSTGG